MAYKLGAKTQPHVVAAANEIGPKFGITNVGGYRAFGSVPNSDHPKGLALDFMTFSKKTHEALAAYVIANADRLGVTYVITWGRIWNASTGKWKTYSGPSPHIDHVHVSFSANGGSGGGVIGVSNQTGIPNPLDPSTWPIVRELEQSAARLSDPEFWKRLGLYVLGAFCIWAGLAVLIRRPAEEAMTDVVKIAKVIK